MNGVLKFLQVLCHKKKILLLKCVCSCSGLARRCLPGWYIKVPTQLSVLWLAVLDGRGGRVFWNTKERVLAMEHVHLWETLGLCITIMEP